MQAKFDLRTGHVRTMWVCLCYVLVLVLADILLDRAGIQLNRGWVDWKVRWKVGDPSERHCIVFNNECLGNDTAWLAGE